MMLVRYLLEYTLATVCHGNRSECARRLWMEYAELRKIRKRMSEGGGSNRVTEALLEMYWREGLSVDEVFRQYTNTQLGSDLEAVEQVCEEMFAAVRESMKMEISNVRRSDSLMKSAYKFVEQMQNYFCEDVCMRSRYRNEVCPARKMVEFINWLRKEINESYVDSEEENKQS